MNVLNVVLDLTRRIAQEEKELSNLQDWTGRITSELKEVVDNVKRHNSSVEMLVVHMTDKEELIASLKKIRADCASELIKLIDETVSDTELKTILVERYVFAKPFKQIARKLNIVERHCFRQHQKAVQQFIRGTAKLDS